MNPNVERAITDGIFRHQFEGFRGYPRENDSRFLEVFHESSVSVSHARATAEAFEQAMPTLQDIRDTARNLRPKFEAQVSQREQWEREYGPPRPFEVPNVAASFGQSREREIDRLWKDLLAYFRSNNFEGKGDIQRVQIGRCWQIARHFGYKMNSYQTRDIEDYERANPRSRESLPERPQQRPRPEPAKPITQADFDALPKRDGKALAAGDDSSAGTKDEEPENRWD